jgi:hypothetical protein
VPLFFAKQPVVCKGRSYALADQRFNGNICLSDKILMAFFAREAAVLLRPHALCKLPGLLRKFLGKRQPRRNGICH